MDALSSKRIVLLGKTGSGKSSLANTIFGETLFTTNHSPNSEASECQAKTKSVEGESITLIDTPGFFDTDRSEEDLKSEIVRCITECAPGPHAFLIVLKVGTFTDQEQHVIKKICQCFSDVALKYAVIVFTHGDQLPDGMKIEEFVSQNKNLSDFVKRCGGRCHVVDNRYWRNNGRDSYRCNQFQVAKLLNTVDKMTEANQGRWYTNEMLQEVERRIQKEIEHIRQPSLNMAEITNKAKNNVYGRLLIQLAGCATGALLGALFGVAETVISIFRNPQGLSAPARTGEMALLATNSGLQGGLTGYNAAEGANTPVEAMQKAAKAVWDQSGLQANQNNT